MFDLEQAIAAWRRELIGSGLRAADDLDELESHLREGVEQQTRAGLAAENAFEAAVLQIGNSSALKNEYKKADPSIIHLMKRFILNLFGIAEPQLATGMNAASPQPRFDSIVATYLKAAAFAFPALFFWLVSAFFVLPKVNQICQNAGNTTFHFDQAPLFFRAFAVISQALVYLTEHSLIVFGVLAAALVLLEWRAKNWPRYRRATFGIGSFLFNTVVLITITMMVISAVMAATNQAPR